MDMAQGFRMAAVGDVVLTRSLTAATEVDPRFGAMIEMLDRADLAFANLETVLSRSGYPREKIITLRADPGLIDDLKRLGFDVMSLANNHTVDFGEDALLATVELLEGHGIRTVGGGADLDAALEPAVVRANGSSVAFLAATCLLPVGSAASDERPGLAPIHVHSSFEVDAYIQMEEPGHAPVVHTIPDPADLARVCERVRRAKESADFVVVSVHMGFGFGEQLAEYQPLVGHALIDAGADLVLGNHVHAIHGIETYRSRAILYSPGNFVAQQPRDGQPPEVLAIYEQMSNDAYLAMIDVRPDGGYRLELTPTVVNDDGLPVRAEGEAFQRICDRIIRLSALLNSDCRVDSGAVVLELKR
jgi:poly-gamma-glutamate capsule biosynthesis protein CapA/YwtB (metallophosphatase superfamily)